MMPEYALAALAVGNLVAVTGLLAWYFRDVAPTRRWMSLLFPLSQIAVVVFLLHYALTYRFPLWAPALMVLVSVLCGGSDWLLFKALRAAEEKELVELRARLLESQIALQQAHRERLERDAEEARAIRQNLIEELEDVDALLAHQELSEASVQLRRVSQHMGGEDGRFCEHRVVDALMGAKAQVCAEKGIRLTVQMDVPDDLSLLDVELCALFSNVMDNAVRACACADPANRFIDLKAHVDSGFFVMQAINGCAASSSAAAGSSKAPLWQAGLPKHGWGLTILKVVAERRNGMLEAKRDGRTFRTTVILEVPATVEARGA